MKGFLKRDLYLARWSLLVFSGFMLLFGLLCQTLQSLSFTWGLYTIVFCGSSLMGLFTYDEVGGWSSYTVSVPNGRRAMVTARYGLGALVTLGAVGFLTVFNFFSGGPQVSVGLWYGGLTLIYLAVTMPLCYYFGARKTRIFLAGGMAALMGIGMAIFGITQLTTPQTGLAGRDLVSAVTGLLLFGLSRKCSLRIVEKKEY